MGLDVYLYRIEDHVKASALLEEYNRESNRIWKVDDGRKYEEIPEEEREANRTACATVAERLGLGEYGELPRSLSAEIRIDSSLYPEHMFKIGYLRSSYNAGGIDSVTERLLGKPGLYWIFEADGSLYEFQPSWKRAATRARKLAKELRKQQAETPFEVHMADSSFLRDPLDSEITTEKKALDVFMENWRRHQGEKSPLGSSYSNNQGEFFLDSPLTVRAIIPGITRIFGPRPCFYVVFDRENTDDWYGQALDITAEMCEWVLAQPDVDKYWLHWSS